MRMRDYRPGMAVVLNSHIGATIYITGPRAWTGANNLIQCAALGHPGHAAHFSIEVIEPATEAQILAAPCWEPCAARIQANHNQPHELRSNTHAAD